MQPGRASTQMLNTRIGNVTCCIQDKTLQKNTKLWFECRSIPHSSKSRLNANSIQSKDADQNEQTHAILCLDSAHTQESPTKSLLSSAMIYTPALSEANTTSPGSPWPISHTWLSSGSNKSLALEYIAALRTNCAQTFTPSPTRIKDTDDIDHRVQILRWGYILWLRIWDLGVYKRPPNAVGQNIPITTSSDQ